MSWTAVPCQGTPLWRILDERGKSVCTLLTETNAKKIVEAVNNFPVAELHQNGFCPYHDEFRRTCCWCRAAKFMMQDQFSSEDVNRL